MIARVWLNSTPTVREPNEIKQGEGPHFSPLSQGEWAYRPGGEFAMTDSKFEARVKASGLRPKPADMPMLEALVRDLDRAAAMLRGPRPYAQEPLNAFRLSPAQVSF
jgi:hypothetical protein